MCNLIVLSVGYLASRWLDRNFLAPETLTVYHYLEKEKEIPPSILATNLSASRDALEISRSVPQTLTDLAKRHPPAGKPGA